MHTQFVNRTLAREGLVGLRIGGVGQGDEKDGRDAFAEAWRMAS